MNITQAIDTLLKKDSMFNHLQALEHFIQYYSYSSEKIENPINTQIGTPCESHFKDRAWKTINTTNLKIVLDFKIKKRSEKTTDKEVQHRGRVTDINYRVNKTGIEKTFFLDSTNPNSLRQNLDDFADTLKGIHEEIKKTALEKKEITKFNKKIKEAVPLSCKDRTKITYSNGKYFFSLKNLTKEEIEKVVTSL